MSNTRLNASHDATAMEQSIRFTLWAKGCRNGPTAKAIQETFQVSRATAYRWLAAWRLVTGVPSTGDKA